MNYPPRSHRRPLRDRRGRAVRPACEALDGRALLSAAVIDPGFNGGQPVTNGGATGTTATSLNDAASVAVQADGKVVVLGTVDQPNSTATGAIALRRYNADGTLDTTFGTGGEVDPTEKIPPLGLPTFESLTSKPSADVLIQPDGKIVYAIDLGTVSSGTGDETFSNLETLVVRLNADGSMDTTFGTKGETIISTDAANLTHLALQPDGKILLAGTGTLDQAGSGGSAPQALAEVAALRLNTDGSIDSSFNGGNLLTFAPNTFGALSGAGLAGLAVAPSGAVVLAWDVATADGARTPDISLATGTDYQVAELNTDGTLDPAFGTGGVAFGPSPVLNVADPTVNYTAAAVQADGRIVLAGNELIRLNADGSLDTGFAASYLPFNPTTAVVVQPDGRIVVGGTSGTSAFEPTTAPQFAVARFEANGQPDDTFGAGGVASFREPSAASLPAVTNRRVAGLALAPDGGVVVAGTAVDVASVATVFNDPPPTLASELILARLRPEQGEPGLTGNDYDGDGRSDIAAQLDPLAAFAYRSSDGSGDVVEGFGIPGTGQTIPAPGDYDGDGRTDVAAYLPSLGVLAYRPSSGGSDVYVGFGPAGVGAIPVPGDYDGDGRTDPAIYEPSTATFVIDRSSGAGDEAIPFGAAGAGESIPVPGDYDGSGRTELAVYIPVLGALIYRPADGGPDVAIVFGPAGMGASIPVPGDYDGDGKTDLALYLPSTGTFAIHPSGGGANYAVPFGAAGAGDSIPVPGDYDGDGKTDLAVYLPTLGVFASRPSGGGGDVDTAFGLAGLDQSTPAAALPALDPPIPVPQPSPTVTAAAADILIPLDGLDAASPLARKKGAAAPG